MKKKKNGKKKKKKKRKKKKEKKKKKKERNKQNIMHRNKFHKHKGNNLMICGLTAKHISMFFMSLTSTVQNRTFYW